MKKFLSLFLVLCLCFSLFSITSFADESGSTSKAEADYQIARAKEFYFDGIVDVEEYVRKAGSPGYDSMQLLHYQFYGGGDQVYFEAYFYNPLKESLDFSGFAQGNILSECFVNSGSLNFDFTEEEKKSGKYDGNAELDFMFFRVSCLYDMSSGDDMTDDFYYVSEIRVKDNFFEINKNVYVTRSSFDADEIHQANEDGFDKYINVNEYSYRRNTLGYNEAKLVGIDAPIITKEETGNYKITSYIYMYNPSFYSNGFLNVYEKNDDGTLKDCYLEYSFGSTDIVNTGLYSVRTGLFYKLRFEIIMSEEPPDPLSVYIGNICINTTYKDFVFNVKQSIGNSDFDSRFGWSSPEWDLAKIFGTSEYEIEAAYPNSLRFEVAYLYESKYGSEDFNMYLYLQRPEGCNINGYLTAYMSTGGTYYQYRFKQISASRTLVKLELVDKEIVYTWDNDYCRDYYLSHIVFNYTDSDNETREERASMQAHFEFSDYSLEGFPENTFLHQYYITSFAKGEYNDVSDVYLSISLESGQEVYFDEAIGATKVREGFYRIPVTDQILDADGTVSFYIEIYGDYPTYGSLLKYKLNSSSVVFGDVWSVANGSVAPGVRPYSESPQAESEGNKLYSRSNITNEVEIKCTPTYYRINSSANGNNMFQTLASVGFSIHESYFDTDDYDALNDRYVDWIDIVYESAMTSPIFITSDKEFFKNNLDFIKDVNVSGVECKEFSKDQFIGSEIDAIEKGKTTPVGSSKEYFYYVYDGKIQVGSVSDFGTILPNEYYFDEQYQNLYYWFIVDKYEDFDIVVKRDDLNEAIELKSSFAEGFKKTEDRITFVETLDLISYKDATFSQVWEDFNLFKAIQHKWLGMDASVQESVKNIKAIQMIYPSEYNSIKSMSDLEFSNKYYVAEIDAASIKQEVLRSLSTGEIYIFLRFDVYDGYSAEAQFSESVLGEGIVTTEGERYTLSKEKYYKDFDIIQTGLTNSQDTQILKVVMEPISFVGANINADDEIRNEDFTDVGEAIGGLFDGGNDILAWLKSAFATAGIVIGALVVIWVVTKIFGGRTKVKIDYGRRKR